MLARIGFIVGKPLLAAAVLITLQLVTPTYSGPAPSSDRRPAVGIDMVGIIEPRGDFEADPPDDEVTDVYGNEVTAAVATYKVDAAGTLYELHSPQTELPRLASPKS